LCHINRLDVVTQTGGSGGGGSTAGECLMIISLIRLTTILLNVPKLKTSGTKLDGLATCRIPS